MKRQLSNQGDVLPKKHCPTRQFASQTQGLLPCVNQTNQYLYDKNKAYGDLSEQPAQKSYYHNNNNYSNPYGYYYNSNSNYNYTNITSNDAGSQNNGLLQENNIANGWNKPMQYNPLQFPLAEHVSAQFAPVQCAPADFTSAPFTSAQFAPAKPIDFNMTLGVNSTKNDSPISYHTRAPDLVSERVFPIQDPWNAGVLRSSPQQPNQSVVNGQLSWPGSNQPGIGMTAVSVNANMTQNGPDGRNNTSGVSFHLSTFGALGTQVPKPPKKRRRPTKREEPQGNNDAVDLVMMTTRTPKLSTLSSPTPRLSIPKLPTQELLTPSPVIKAPLAPVNQSIESSQLPDAKEPQGDIAKPCKAPDYEDTLEDGIGAIKEHLELLAQQETEDKRRQEEKEREEAEKKRTEEFKWPGNPSEYPAECFANIRLLGCEFRAHAIYIGSPRPGLLRDQYNVPPKGWLAVYAVRRGSDGVEFKLVKPHSTPEEVLQASEIQFNDIKLSDDFSDMNEPKVKQFSRYLLDAVPGRNDSRTMWSKE
ncbi:hypothetical protein F4782DRAFT_546713 [Xylaria castorea]|nr:hypothetical protein F4782DRAFT_546713 [Xylaria castorea]